MVASSRSLPPDPMDDDSKNPAAGSVSRARPPRAQDSKMKRVDRGDDSFLNNGWAGHSKRKGSNPPSHLRKQSSPPPLFSPGGSSAGHLHRNTWLGIQRGRAVDSFSLMSARPLSPAGVSWRWRENNGAGRRGHEVERVTSPGDPQTVSLCPRRVTLDHVLSIRRRVTLIL